MVKRGAPASTDEGTMALDALDWDVQISATPLQGLPSVSLVPPSKVSEFMQIVAEQPQAVVALGPPMKDVHSSEFCHQKIQVPLLWTPPGNDEPVKCHRQGCLHQLCSAKPVSLKRKPTNVDSIGICGSVAHVQITIHETR